MMVNGNYVLYGDRPSSESEVVEDHAIQTRTAERKVKRKPNRSANELQHTLNMAQLDNETDAVKYEKKIKEPRLLRYVPTTDVEENFVSEKFETYDLKPTEERPKRYAFTKKPKNPSDGSVNYAYSRSSSSSPNANLPTISEHGEHYGTYRVRPIPSPISRDIMAGYESKLEKYFVKPKDMKDFTSKGSHPDSLYRVPTSSAAGVGKMARAVRVLRWPAALITVCVALAVFVYFLMPDHIQPDLEAVNSTDWETSLASSRFQAKVAEKVKNTSPVPSTTKRPGSKTSEMDFYDTDIDKNIDIISIDDKVNDKNVRKLPAPPVFPAHITPEVQYGNEKADSDKSRTPKILDDSNAVGDSTLKPHITHRPEKPLAIYFKDAIAVTETITRAETVNDFTNFDEKLTTKETEEPPRRYASVYKKPTSLQPNQQFDEESDIQPEFEEFYPQQPAKVDVPITSGHSKFFGIGIEDAEKMTSTTQNSIYNTRVSPTLPTWRDGDDTTTKKYPVNINTEVPQCHSPHLALCRGVLPYDLAGTGPTHIDGHEIESLLPQIEYLIATNCSERLRQFFCALLEPECSPPPFPPKKPCYTLCRAIIDSCEGYLPRELVPAFKCKQYASNNCVAARSPCSIRELPCGDGTCVPRDWMCDGTRDCPAGEDEELCTICEKNEYRCASGMCIQQRWVCDGYSDCPDGDDEEESVCGERTRVEARTAKVEAETEAELGEEPAGSAPAPSVRRPNKIHVGKFRNSALRGDNDSSKELLVTSDSSNALKRNFTRRPSPSRLTPYQPKSRYSQPTETPTEATEEEKPRKIPVRKSRTTTTTAKPENRHFESAEDVNIDDLGFFEEIGEPKKEQGSKAKTEDVVPPPAPELVSKIVNPPAETSTAQAQFDKNINKLEKVIDGASMLRKAAAEQQATRELAYNNTEMVDDYPIFKGTSSHVSPCPSGELRCVDGRCITLAQLCDGTIDCTDHADEDNCYT